MDKKIIVFLFIIFIFAFLLRVYYLPRLALIFEYDQARDAFVVREIISGDLKILGPPSSTPGLFHGVFYYYFLAPAYLLGKGNPIVASYWVAFFNAMGIFILFALVYLLVKKRTTALLASFLFAVSFEASQYATWLSNPTLGVWTVPLAYLGVWMWITKPSFLDKKRWIGPLACAIGLGLSIQSEIFLAYHLVPVLFWLWIGRKNINFGQILEFVLALLFSLSSIILAEFKFGFRGLGALASLITTQDALLNLRGFGDFLVLYLNQLGRSFSNSLFPFNVGYGGFVGFWMLYWAIKNWKGKTVKILSWEPFLTSYILAHITVVSLGGISTPFLTVGIGSGIIAFSAIVISKIWTKNRNLSAVLAFIIIVSNLVVYFREAKRGQIIFAIQKDMLLSKELEAIDFTYSAANGDSFSLNTLTSPLWVNTTWSYLYNWYGKEKYGVVPEWHGRDQVGQLGNNLPPTSKDTSLYFLILEPMQGIPGKYLLETVNQEDSHSQLIEEKHFGEITVQKRIKI